MGSNFDDVAHVQIVHRCFKHQRARIFHRVIENGGHLSRRCRRRPARLLGMPGVSSPKYHNTELVADFREEPVPTTSPTKATGKP